MTAQNVATKVQNKSDALQVITNNGIGGDLLGKINGYLNNPMAGFIATAAGVDLQGVKNMMNDLTGSGGASKPPAANSNDNLAKLRAGLQQLKR